MPMKKKQFPYKLVLWWLPFLLYLVVVIYATLLHRTPTWSHGVISLSSTYKEAWIRASFDAWKNMILNILMFVPLGFWLPVGYKWFRKFWRTYLFGFLATLGIETLQILLSRGLFEVADLVHNTLGAMVGYGFFQLATFLIRIWKKKERHTSALLLSQLPLVITIFLFFGLYLLYQMQELGNLGIQCISPYDMEQLQITSHVTCDPTSGKAMVYKTSTLSREDTRQFAKDFFANLGGTLDEDRIDLYESTAIYWGDTASSDTYSLWIDYKGGSYSFTDFATSFPDTETVQVPAEITDASEDTILTALQEYGITLPKAARFSYDPTDGYVFTTSLLEGNDIIYDGVLTCRYFDNGKFANIEYRILPFEPYKEFEICSEEEAFKELLSGNFISDFPADAEFAIEKVSLDYLLDTKGFYQPVYTFSGTSDGEAVSIQIPAIK